MELGDWQTAMGERYIQMLRPAMTRQQTWYTKICKSGFTDMFFPVYFFGGGFAPLVLPSDIVTSRNKGALPPCFFLPGFLCFAYIMLCIYIYIRMVVSISMAFAYWAQPLNCRMLENQLREDEFKADFRHQSFERTKMPSLTKPQVTSYLQERFNRLLYFQLQLQLRRTTTLS